jgi:Phage tail lysozyme/Peptidase_C39 like family
MLLGISMDYSKNISKFIKIYFLLFIMVASFGFGSARAFATDTTFFSGNNILFYDPESCVVGSGEGTSALVGNDNLEKILRYFVGKGLTLVQASGIAGNLSQESGFNPAIIGGDAPVVASSTYVLVSGTGFGIAQWTDPSRQQGLTALSKSTNRTVIDLSLQLDYMWQEMTTTFSGSLVSLKASTTPDNAAYVFHRDYEGSADTEEEVRVNRGNVALSINNQFATIIPDGTTSTTTSATACTGNGKASEFVDGFAIYNQNDVQWANEVYGPGGTIGSSGCGPSAMAMIITALTNKAVTPSETAAYGRDPDHSTVYTEGGVAAGSNYKVGSILAEHWGLKATALTKDVAKINQGLRDGGLVIMSGTGAAPFTTGGHFIVIRAVTGDGKWLIGDSNSTVGIENSKKEYDPVYILSMNVSGYINLITK